MPTREDLMKYDLDELVIVIICKEAGLKHTSNDEAAKRFTKWDGFRIARNTLAHDLIMTDEFKQSMLVGNEDYVDVICKDLPPATVSCYEANKETWFEIHNM